MGCKPLVSVCMPAYNAEKYIGEAVLSVVNQTYQNWELIIVNDGSTDGTLNIINKFSDSRIRIINQENRGQCAAANKAFEECIGEFVKFFDADDILSLNMLDAQVKLLCNLSDSVASSKWGRFYKNDLKSFKQDIEVLPKVAATDEWLVKAWKNGMPMMQCGLWLIPRNIIIKSGPWDEKLSLINDFDFFTRILLNSKNVFLTEDANLFYRSGLDNSLSGTKSRKAYQSAYSSLYKGTTALLKKRSDIEAKKACANLWMVFSYEIYPYYKDLAMKANVNLSSLPNPTVKFPAGGLSKLLLPLLGWKIVKRLQRIKSTLST